MLANPEVLDEEAVPERELVVHRRDELDRLLETLRPVGTGPADLVYLLGPTGTGKTMLARLALNVLANDDAAAREATIYQNCWQHYERVDVLYQILDTVQDTLQQKRAISRSRILAGLNDLDGPLYIVLDEADQLTDLEVLYDLHELGHVHLVLVANREEDLFGTMGPRLRSRLTVGMRIECGRYRTDELAAILAKRANSALGVPDAVDRRTLEYIASQSGGDARVAIRTLRVALDDGGDLDRAAADAALPEARDQLRQKSLDNLNQHQRTIYLIIEEDGPIAPGDLYATYQERSDNPRTERTARSYLSKLEQFDILPALPRRDAPRLRTGIPERWEFQV
jgi:Cdc6-like AAA superfamily ATPase